MFEMLLWLFFMGACSFLFNFLWKLRQLGPFRFILVLFGVIGVLIHELSHVLFCFMTGVKVEGFRVSIWSHNSHRIAPNGEVNAEIERTFLQQLVISLAPLLIQTWSLLFFLDIIFTPGMDLILIVVFYTFLWRASPTTTEF